MEQVLPIIIVTPPLPSKDDLPEMMKLALDAILNKSSTAPAVEHVAGDVPCSSEAWVVQHRYPVPSNNPLPMATSLLSPVHTALPDAELERRLAARSTALAELEAEQASSRALVLRRPRTVQRSGSRRHARVFDADGVPLPTAASQMPFVTSVPAAVGMAGIHGCGRKTSTSTWRGGLGTFGLKLGHVARALGMRK
ncbi:hypothetical protein FA95DRAFT_1604950 [Auriscalpium vulgare]|uniref:Uncharacterized protein n=1 Tax=Auriscalpium vulgare TaxID=40419 RepID=A0ACB8RX58_9AGAM|nr:hypothetical protein FA95DRAFT_1604950 [Auriscalpium vulgare]